MNGLIVMPGSLCGVVDTDFGVREWRTMLRGVRGESNSVNFRSLRAATGDEVGEHSVSGAKPHSWAMPWARAGDKRRRRRANLRGEGDDDERCSTSMGRINWAGWILRSSLHEPLPERPERMSLLFVNSKKRNQ